MDKQKIRIYAEIHSDFMFLIGLSKDRLNIEEINRLRSILKCKIYTLSHKKMELRTIKGLSFYSHNIREDWRDGLLKYLDELVNKYKEKTK